METAPKDDAEAKTPTAEEAQDADSRRYARTAIEQHNSLTARLNAYSRVIHSLTSAYNGNDGGPSSAMEAIYEAIEAIAKRDVEVLNSSN